MDSIQDRVQAFAVVNQISYDAALLYLADVGLQAQAGWHKAGKARFAGTTKEQRRAFARAGGLARWRKTKTTGSNS